MPSFFSYLELFSLHSWHGMWAAMSILASLCLPWRHISSEASWVWCQTFQAVYQRQEDKILLDVASPLPAVLPSRGNLRSVPSPLQQLALRARPSRSVESWGSPEDGGFNQQENALPDPVLWGHPLCRGTPLRGGGAVRGHPGVAPGPAGSWARSSGALIRTDITHHNATGPPRQKGHGLFWKCYLMLISLYIGHWPQEWPAKIGCDLFPGKICYLPSFSWIWFVHDHPKSGLNLIQGFSRAWTRLMGNLPLNAELLTQVQWQELTCPANTPGCCVLHPACTGGYHSWPGFV